MKSGQTSTPELIKRFVLVTVMLFGGLFVLLRPHPELALTDSCEPQGAIAGLRARVQGLEFWEEQLIYLDVEVDRLASLPEELERNYSDREASWDSLLAEINAVDSTLHRDNDRYLDSLMEALYRDRPSLRPTPEEERADSLRERADFLADSLEVIADSLDYAATRQRQYRSIEEGRSQLAACRSVLLERSSPGTQ